MKISLSKLESDFNVLHASTNSSIEGRLRVFLVLGKVEGISRAGV